MIQSPPIISGRPEDSLMPAWIESMFRARMHSPPLRLDCADPNCAESYSKVVDTGLQEIEVEARKGGGENRKVSCGCHALLVGDRYLIMKSSKPISETTSGELVLISGDIFQPHVIFGGTSALAAAG